MVAAAATEPPQVLEGKVAIVTGSNAGIGRVTAEALAASGARVILACRNVAAAEEAAKEIRAKHRKAKVEVSELDLASNNSVRKFAEVFRAKQLPLHLLASVSIWSIGANYLPLARNSEGIGICAQINFLGPYLLTRLLLDKLSANAPSRIVNVSSIMHRLPTGISDPKQFLHNPKRGKYSACKLSNVLFTYELNRRLSRAKGVTAIAVDPGSVYSSIWKNSGIFGRPPGTWFLQTFYSPSTDGATTTIHACTSLSAGAETTSPGTYYARGTFAMPPVTWASGWAMTLLAPLVAMTTTMDWPLRRLAPGWFSPVRAVRSSPASYDPQMAENLWNYAADVCNLPRDVVSKKLE
eukprot:jgi/Chlat1/3145/Chrsp21S03367